MKTLNIGLVGYGFMGRTHSNAFLQAPRFFDLPYQPVLKAVVRAQCRSREDVRRELGLRVGRDRLARAGRARKDIDLIDIASPNDTHHEIAIAAAKAGKMVMCEKPLGRNGEGSEGDGRRRSKRPACRTRSGTTTAACRR